MDSNHELGHVCLHNGRDPPSLTLMLPALEPLEEERAHPKCLHYEQQYGERKTMVCLKVLLLRKALACRCVHSHPWMPGRRRRPVSQ